MTTPCTTDPLPCAGSPPFYSSDYAVWLATMDELWGGHNPFDDAYLATLRDATCGCLAWRQKWAWSCTADPHAWAKVGDPETVAVPCSQDPFLVDPIDVNDCAVWAYGDVWPIASIPDVSDAPDPPNFPALDDSICCPTTHPCQVVIVFKFNETTCAWEVLYNPVTVVGTPGDTCVKTFDGSLEITRISEVQNLAMDVSCDWLIANPPAGFTTVPIAPVEYAICVKEYENIDCMGSQISQLLSAVSFDPGVDDCTEFKDTFLNGNCYGDGRTFTKAEGPFCGGTSEDWVAAHPEVCPPL